MTAETSLEARRKLKLGFLGAGCVASAIAFELVSNAGYSDVSFVARGKRLEQLRRDAAIVARLEKDKATSHAPVAVYSELNVDIAFDILFVAVLAHQLDNSLRAALKASKARTVCFMFGTLRPLSEYRDIVGANRFAFAFSGTFQAWWGDEETRELVYYKNTSLLSPFTDVECSKVFEDAGGKAVLLTLQEMQAYLRTQPPLFIAITCAIMPAIRQDRAGATYVEAYILASAVHEWWAITRSIGEIPPPSGGQRFLTNMPVFLLAALIWMMSRMWRARFLRLNPEKLTPPETFELFKEFEALVGKENAARVERLRPPPNP